MKTNKTGKLLQSATLLGLLALLPFGSLAGDSQVLYQKDFSQEEAGAEPLDFLVLNGRFTVREVDDNKLLELPGAPLDSFGLLFGPTETQGIEVSARISSDKKGRRYPTFGVGLNGVGGYRLMVAPAKRAIELYRNDQLVKALDYRWPANQWTHFRLRITAAGEGRWNVAGKVWTADGEEPKAWQIQYQEKEDPIPGRPSIWGMPYSGKPIQFDDLKVLKAQ